MMSGEPLVIAEVDPASAEALALIAALDAELRVRYPGAEIEGLRPGDAAGRFAFLVARLTDQTVGCGAVRELEPAVGEIKRMFVRAEYRGRGIARAMLTALESKAGELGYAVLRIETGI